MKAKSSLIFTLVLWASSTPAEPLLCPQLFEVTKKEDTSATVANQAEVVEKAIMNSWMARPEAIEGNVTVVATKIQQDLSEQAAHLMNSAEARELFEISDRVLKQMETPSQKFSFRNLLKKKKSQIELDREKFEEVNKCLARFQACQVQTVDQKQKLENIRQRFASLYSHLETLRTGSHNWSETTVNMLAILNMGLVEQIDVIDVHLKNLTELETQTRPSLSAIRSRILLKHPEFINLIPRDIVTNNTNEAVSPEIQKIRETVEAIKKATISGVRGVHENLIKSTVEKELFPLFVKNPEYVVEFLKLPLPYWEFTYRFILKDNQIAQKLNYSDFSKISHSLPPSHKPDFIAFWWMHVMSGKTSQDAHFMDYRQIIEKMTIESDSVERKDGALAVIVLMELTGRGENRFDRLSPLTGAGEDVFGIVDFDGYIGGRRINSLRMSPQEFPEVFRYLQFLPVSKSKIHITSKEHLLNLIKSISSRKLYEILYKTIQDYSYSPSSP